MRPEKKNKKQKKRLRQRVSSLISKEDETGKIQAQPKMRHHNENGGVERKSAWDRVRALTSFLLSAAKVPADRCTPTWAGELESDLNIFGYHKINAIFRK